MTENGAELEMQLGEDTAGNVLEQRVNIEVVRLRGGVQLNHYRDTPEGRQVLAGVVLERRPEGLTVRVHKNDDQDPQVIVLPAP